MQDPGKLLVVEKARALTKLVFAATSRIRDPDALILRGQLRRAVQSIRAQIVEGCYKHSEVEFARYLGISIGSANEALVHATDLVDLGYLPRAAVAPILDQTSHVLAMTINLRKRVHEKLAYEEDARREKRTGRRTHVSRPDG